MKRSASVSILCGVSAALFGCAGEALINQTQCEVGDWETLGMRDGEMGRRSSHLLELQNACNEYGVAPDRETYMRGWTAGARHFCTPSNGFDLGESGRSHNNICAEDLRESFVAAFQAGRTLNDARVRVSDLENKIETDTARLEQARSGLISTAAAQLNPLLTPTRRGELVAELQGLNDEKNRLIADIPRARLDLVTAKRELDDLNRSAGTSY